VEARTEITENVETEEKSNHKRHAGSLGVQDGMSGVGLGAREKMGKVTAMVTR
jgi:hypothetical protein